MRVKIFKLLSLFIWVASLLLSAKISIAETEVSKKELQFDSGKVPNGLFSISGIMLGKATFDEVRKVFGPAKTENVPYRDTEIAIETLCYKSSSEYKQTYLFFQSSAWEIYPERIVVFVLTTRPPKAECSVTKINLATLTTANGIGLGKNRKKFKVEIPVKFFARSKDRLVYLGMRKRPARENEVEFLAKKSKETGFTFPNEFEIHTGIGAQFGKFNQLTELEVSLAEFSSP